MFWSRVWTSWLTDLLLLLRGNVMTVLKAKFLNKIPIHYLINLGKHLNQKYLDGFGFF